MKTAADAVGIWRIELDMKDSLWGSFEIAVQGNNNITISDVLMGEVRLAAGQSNTALSRLKLGFLPTVPSGCIEKSACVTVPGGKAALRRLPRGFNAASFQEIRIIPSPDF